MASGGLGLLKLFRTVLIRYNLASIRPSSGCAVGRETINTFSACAPDETRLIEANQINNISK